MPAPSIVPSDAALAQAALHALQFDLSPADRETAARAIVERIEGALPRLAGAVNESAVAALRCDALLRLGPILSDRQAIQVREHFQNQPCYSAHVSSYGDGLARPLDEAARIGPYGSYRLDQALQAPYLLELAMDPTILALAQAYLGCLPTLYSIHAWWTFAGQPGPALTHGFHRDQDDHRSLALFLYLTDVGEDDGPIDLIPGTHRIDWVAAALDAHRVRHPDTPTRDALDFFPPRAGNGYDDRPGKVPIPYAELFPDGIARLTGPAGSAFLADPFALHRGNPPTRRHRLACWIRYGISRNRVYELDGLEPVPASSLPRRPPRSPCNDWIGRLVIDPDR